MNLTDLRDELSTHADDLGPAADLRAGVAQRVRTTKRRRAVAGGSVATLAVAALAVGVMTSVGQPAPVTPAGSPSASAAPMIGADGMPFRTVPDAPGDVIKDGLRYRAKVGDDRLAAGFIGDRGQAQFTLVWEPTTTHVAFGAECYLPGLSDAEAAKYMVSIGVGGTKGFFGSGCSASRPTERDLPSGGGIPGGPGQGWSELTVGQAASVRVRLIDAKTFKPAAVDGAQLTGAVYELGSATPIKDASGEVVASLPDVIEQQGYRYLLKETKVAPAARNAMPSLPTPAGVPFLATAGMAGSDASPSRGTIYVTGLDEQTGATGGGYQTVSQPARAAGRVGLRSEGAAPEGTAFVAIYTLATDRR